MIYILRNPDGTIKTYAEQGQDFVLQPGETMDVSSMSFVEYANRFTLALQDRQGDLIHVKVGDPQLVVLVSCPGESTVDLDINGTVETVQLTHGSGQIALSTATPGMFIIQPADRKTYPAAGMGFITVEVTE